MKSISSLIAMGVDVQLPEWLDPKLMVFFWLSVAGGVFYTLGDICIKKWAVGQQSAGYYWMGLAIWMIGMCILGYMFKYENMAVASLYVCVANVICLFIVSALMFGEPVSRVQLVGVALGIVSMVCLYKG